MSGNRLLSKEKLDEFSKDFMGLAMEALEKGDIEKAKFWIRRQDDTKDIVHDAYLRWVTGLLDRIYKRWGENEAIEALRDSTQVFSVPLARMKTTIIEAGGVEAWMEIFVDFMRQHSMYPNVTIEEDDEKFIITMQPCGSGGRLIDAGAYEGPFGYAKIKEAGCHTWGEKDVPIYCAHCPWAQEIWPVTEAGEGGQTHIHASPFPKKPGDPCIHYVYKDPKDIPDKYYDRIGMDKTPKELPRSYGIE